MIRAVLFRAAYPDQFHIFQIVQQFGCFLLPAIKALRDLCAGEDHEGMAVGSQPLLPVCTGQAGAVKQKPVQQLALGAERSVVRVAKQRFRYADKVKSGGLPPGFGLVVRDPSPPVYGTCNTIIQQATGKIFPLFSHLLGLHNL